MDRFWRAPRSARHSSIAAVSSLIVALFAAPSADARITKIEITSTQTPTFGGHSWPGVGQYRAWFV